ncbi:MAG: ArsA family ATPase, partial [Solirubrobacterales bacterium]|nr:ArsA family ATPase [Solirubrobacterales bacterium]
MRAVLDKRLVFVTGKGGVGKTTVAAALGVAAAAQGRRVIVAEVSARGDAARTLTADARAVPAFAEREVGPGLHHISIDPEHAMQEYLVDQLPLKALADALVASRLFTYLAAATPGMRELLTVGKIWELAQDVRRTPGARPYDLVVVDAPATGHGLALLGAPRTFAHAARVGPINRQGRTIDEMLSDPRRTGVIAVTTAEETPVSETLALRERLRTQAGLELDGVACNLLLPGPLSAAEQEALDAALEPAARAGGAVA